MGNPSAAVDVFLELDVVERCEGVMVDVIGGVFMSV